MAQLNPFELEDDTHIRTMSEARHSLALLGPALVIVAIVIIGSIIGTVLIAPVLSMALATMPH